MTPICQTRLSCYPWMEARSRALPGTSAIAPDQWLQRDECFAAQTQYKAELIARRGRDVLMIRPESRAACTELLDMVSAHLDIDMPIGGPLEALAALTQEDWIILQSPDAQSEPIATAGLLCFPASWTLSEKIGHPLTRIHAPVPGYKSQIAARVSRMINSLKPNRPIMRANFLIYDTPELHHPLREGEHRPVNPEGPHWVRVERQTLRALPSSGAAAFGIHTSIVLASALPEDAFTALKALRPQLTR